MFRMDKGDAFVDIASIVALDVFLFLDGDDKEDSKDEFDFFGMFGMNRMTSIILMKDPNADIKAADCSL